MVLHVSTLTVHATSLIIIMVQYTLSTIIIIIIGGTLRQPSLYYHKLNALGFNKAL